MTSKKEMIRLLKEKKYDDLAGLPLSGKKIISLLISLSYDKKDVISWRAMEAIGLITKKLAVTDPDSVMNTVRRLLWMIRDESGGIGWSAPEIIGEIVRNNPVLCSDIATIITSFHEEEMLTAGVMRAIGRIGDLNTESTGYAVPFVIQYLRSPDPAIRGHAAWASGELGASIAVNELEVLKNDAGTVSFYKDGELTDRSIGEIAANAIAKLKREKTASTKKEVSYV